MIQPLVYKFGGASIKDAKAIQRIAQLLKSRWVNNLVIVVSAAGKTTDRLEELISLSFENKEFSRPLLELMEYHLDLCKGLFEEDHSIYARVENHFAQLHRALENTAIKDNQGFF